MTAIQPSTVLLIAMLLCSFGLLSCAQNKPASCEPPTEMFDSITVIGSYPSTVHGEYRYAAGSKYPWVKGTLRDSVLKSWLARYHIPTDYDPQTSCYKVFVYCDSLRADSTTGVVLDSIVGFTVYYLDFTAKRLFVSTYIVERGSAVGIEIPELGMEIGRFNADVAPLTIEHVLPKHGLSARGFFKVWSQEYSDRTSNEIMSARYRVPEKDDTFEKTLESYHDRHSNR